MTSCVIVVWPHGPYPAEASVQIGDVALRKTMVTSSDVFAARLLAALHKLQETARIQVSAWE